MNSSRKWRVARLHGGAAITVETESGELIAQVYDHYVDAEANARLICQAPRMLPLVEHLAHVGGQPVPPDLHAEARSILDAIHGDA